MNKTTSNLTELEEIFDRLYQPIFDDFIRYCKEWLRIKDEDGNILPFELNELQLYVFREMMKQKAELGYIRLNILKCRQTGISTVIEAYIHWENHKDFNLKTIIIGHESEASGNLYDMYFRYHENLPEEVKPIIDKNQHQKKISYLKLKNEIVVKTAKAGVDYTKAGSGRSGTFNYIHATECLGGDSKIILWDGTAIPIKDIAIGDCVATSEGRLGTVVNKLNNGIKQTYKLSVWYSNEPIEVTDNHKILTQNGWKEVRDLTTYDYVALPKIEFTNTIKNYTTYYQNTPKTKQRLGGSKAKESLTIPFNYDWGYVIGYYLAEGHVKKDFSRVSFTYHQDETYINRVMKTIGGRPKTVLRQGKKTKITTFYDRTLAKLIWELAGRTANKEVPDIVFDTNSHFAEGIIHGFYAGDGCKTRSLIEHGKYEINRATFVNTNERVMRQIRRILISLEYGVGSLRTQSSVRYGKKGLQRYDLDLFGDGAAKLLQSVGGYVAKKSRINKLKTIKIDSRYYVKVKSIEKSIEQEVFDITIDQNEHDFETTIGIVHNCAFYPDYKTTFLGLLQASKKARLIVVETTANGFNEYRSDYFDAKNGRSDYLAIFLSWLDFKTYTKPFRSDAEKEKLQRTLGVDPRYNEYKGEEQLLIEFHNATLEQLNWRRWAIDNLCKGEVMHFHQEYPKDDIEAFLSTGTPVFNVQICKTNLEEATKQKESGNYKIGELIPVYDFTSAEYRRLVALGKTDYQSLSPFIKEIKFQENVKGFIRLHYETKLRDDERYRFVGGSDVAEGLAQGDFTVCKVMDRKTNQVILTWHGHLNTDLYAEELHKIQVYFNNQIYFAVERNNHGLAVINYAHRLGVNLYYAETFEKGFTENTELLGFKTHAGTRTQMINDLKAAIRDGEFADSEPEFWEETLTFVFNEHGKMQAQGKDKDPSIKSYDDRIFAAIGMWKCHLWMPNFKKVKVEDTNVEALLKRIKEKNRKLTAGTTAMSR